MARFDPEVIAILDAGQAPSAAQLAALDGDQLDALTRLALLQIGLDFKQPSAARVSALKDALTDEGTPGTTGESDPGQLSLDQIDQELSRLTAGTAPRGPGTQ